MHQEKVVTAVALKQLLNLQPLQRSTLEKQQLALETAAASQHYSSPGSGHSQQSLLGGSGAAKRRLQARQQLALETAAVSLHWSSQPPDL